MSTIEREIYFYRIDSGKDSSGQPILFNPVPTLEHIDKLKWDSKGKYMQDENDRILACWVDNKDMPSKIRVGSIRRRDFPQVEERGEVTPLEIPESSGLVEHTHVVFLGDNIVGCDFNFYGPRITRLSYYFAEKAVGIAPPMINFCPILRKDIYLALQKVKYLKLFNLKIRAPFADIIKDIDVSLAESFKAAIEVAEADEIELILKASGHSKGWLSERLLDTSKKLVKRQDLQYDIKKFGVKGYDEEKQRMVELDLLSDKLIVKKSINKAERRSRALNPKSAYYAIISAYEELKDEILSSASIDL